MARDLKMLPRIDVFVLVINGEERFGKQDIMENLLIYQELCGGKLLWENVIIVLTKVDYNSFIYDEVEEWK